MGPALRGVDAATDACRFSILMDMPLSGILPHSWLASLPLYLAAVRILSTCCLGRVMALLSLPWKEETARTYSATYACGTQKTVDNSRQPEGRWWLLCML